ncbi:MAG: DUF4160 domain-containing protein [Bacteroidetes bacterium]|nr:DUF4160 domain-containing protein [Bacteroidota bacterium]MBU1718575.1 DUF4160 domain-containing protein [Bacteroidota bacterium]
MPEISRFYGIIILMYWQEHNPPHFHAEYQGNKMTVDISTLETKGEFPHRAKALIFEWISLHRSELLKNWELSLAGKPMEKIIPLD